MIFIILVLAQSGRAVRLRFSESHPLHLLLLVIFLDNLSLTAYSAIGSA